MICSIKQACPRRSTERLESKGKGLSDGGGIGLQIRSMISDYMDRNPEEREQVIKRWYSAASSVALHMLSAIFFPCFGRYERICNLIATEMYCRKFSCESRRFLLSGLDASIFLANFWVCSLLDQNAAATVYAEGRKEGRNFTTFPAMPGWLEAKS